jgi:hypothetical protein
MKLAEWFVAGLGTTSITSVECPTASTTIMISVTTVSVFGLPGTSRRSGSGGGYLGSAGFSPHWEKQEINMKFYRFLYPERTFFSMRFKAD